MLFNRRREIRCVIRLLTPSRINAITDLQQTLFYITLDSKLYLAPIGPNIHNVLDIATGNALPHQLSINPMLTLERGLEFGQLNSVSHLSLSRVPINITQQICSHPLKSLEQI